MSILALILHLAIFAFLVWLVLQITSPGIIRNIILGVAGFLVIVWLLQSLGIATGLPRLRLW